MPWNKIDGQVDQYLYRNESDEPDYTFIYKPSTGRVTCAKRHLIRAMVHFITTGYDIDDTTKKQSDLDKGYFTVRVPDYLSEQSALEVLTLQKRFLNEGDIALAKAHRDKRILNNIDNTTGNPINEKQLITAMNNMAVKCKERQKLVNWFNRYNIELYRKENPVMRVYTKPINVIMAEGRRAIYALFDKGELRKLTEEEYLAKIAKYSE